MTEIGAAQKAKLAEAWTTGVLDFTMPRNPKDIGELREFAKSKGLLQIGPTAPSAWPAGVVGRAASVLNEVNNAGARRCTAWQYAWAALRVA